MLRWGRTAAHSASPAPSYANYISCCPEDFTSSDSAVSQFWPGFNIWKSKQNLPPMWQVVVPPASLLLNDCAQMPSQGGVEYPWVSEGWQRCCEVRLPCFSRAKKSHPSSAILCSHRPPLCVSFLSCSAMWSSVTPAVAHQALNHSKFPVWDILPHVNTSTHKCVNVCKQSASGHLCTSKVEHTYFSAVNNNHCGHGTHSAC